MNPPKEWLTLRQSMLMTGFNAFALYKMAALQMVRVQALPGYSMKFNRDDLRARQDSPPPLMSREAAGAIR
jgi:hypothetical protein